MATPEKGGLRAAFFSTDFREPGETHYNTFIAEPLEFKTVVVEPPVFSAVASELGRPSALHFPPGSITDDRLELLQCLFGVTGMTPMSYRQRKISIYPSGMAR